MAIQKPVHYSMHRISVGRHKVVWSVHEVTLFQIQPHIVLYIFVKLEVGMKVNLVQGAEISIEEHLLSYCSESVTIRNS